MMDSTMTRASKPLMFCVAALLLSAPVLSGCSRGPVVPQTDSLESVTAAPTVSSPVVSAKADNSTATPFDHKLPLGLPAYHVSDANPMTAEKVELGRKLFFDTALSVDHTMSCATCHDPEKGWSDGLPVATGVNGQPGKRNVPTILNAAYYRALFWGRPRGQS